MVRDEGAGPIDGDGDDSGGRGTAPRAIRRGVDPIATGTASSDTGYGVINDLIEHHPGHAGR